jgi:hypothetical protein
MWWWGGKRQHKAIGSKAVSTRAARAFPSPSSSAHPPWPAVRAYENGSNSPQKNTKKPVPTG